MSNVRKKRVSRISNAKNIEEIGDFWGTHSLADHWDETRDASFTVRATRRRRVTIDPEAYGQIEALARQRGISPETLVNLWVVEHLKKSQKARPAAQRRPRSRAAG
jgi:integrase